MSPCSEPVSLERRLTWQALEVVGEADDDVVMDILEVEYLGVIVVFVVVDVPG